MALLSRCSMNNLHTIVYAILSVLVLDSVNTTLGIRTLWWQAILCNILERVQAVWQGRERQHEQLRTPTGYARQW